MSERLIVKEYIGVKKIAASPKVKDGKEGYEVIYPDGYTSWSPKKVFEEAYVEIGDNESECKIDVLEKLEGLLEDY